jgi:predicted Ser/Thr protein kinase
MTGRTVAHYQVLEKLGAGGMGEVYRARDTRLNRDVALKVLPEAFARDAERMARFEREAQVLASLNHPNIAQLYGLEERALVMEYVPGETLRGPLPVDEVIPVARQIAEALEYAHEKGIVHRDLKPANIKITPDGKVKILDFGLAKALDDNPAAADGSNSPTLSLAATRAGVILGTAAYMSPEQAKGEPVDRRAEIWAFGVVLCELLTGKRVYGGESVPETLAAVIHGEPSIPDAPPHLQRLLRRCLDKDPRRRLQHICEARILLDQAGDHDASEPRPPGSGRAWVPWTIAALFFLSTALLAFLHFRSVPPRERAVRFTVPLPPRGTFQTFQLSPDGRYLVIAGSTEGKSALWLRSLDSLNLQLLPGTDGATYPFWSPDSRFLGFFAQGKLKKIAVTGGPSQTLCNAADGRGGTWSPDAVIVFSPSPSGVLYRVSAAGGEPVAVTSTDSTGGGIHRFPVFLPDAKHFLFLTSQAQPEKAGIYLASLDSKEARRLLSDDSSVAYAPPAASGAPAHLLFLRQGTLMAQPFDARRLQLAGEVFPAAERVGGAGNLG